MANRLKERLLRGYCDLHTGRIYFYGKTSAVSDNQAHFNLCWDIKRCFKIDYMVNPVITECSTFSSSTYLARRVAPSEIRYFSDSKHKEEIKVVREHRGRCASSYYGEEGEEIVDIDF